MKYYKKTAELFNKKLFISGDNENAISLECSSIDGEVIFLRN